MSNSADGVEVPLLRTLLGVIVRFRDDLNTTSSNTTETSAFPVGETMRIAASTSFPRVTGMPRAKPPGNNPVRTFPAAPPGSAPL